jgi:hypothetical protein
MSCYVLKISFLKVKYFLNDASCSYLLYLWMYNIILTFFCKLFHFVHLEILYDRVQSAKTWNTTITTASDLADCWSTTEMLLMMIMMLMSLLMKKLGQTFFNNFVLVFYKYCCKINIWSLKRFLYIYIRYSKTWNFIRFY